MSLQVWLPLNGNLNNQGLSDVTVANNGATVDSNGKIGSCYLFNPAKLSLTPSFITSFHGDFSFSLWLKVNSFTTSYETYLQVGMGTTPWTSYRIGLLRNVETSNLTFCISDGSSSTQNNCYTSYSAGTWYHFTCTYSKTEQKMRIYKNGVLSNTYSTSIIPKFSDVSYITLGQINDGPYKTNCLMNDFRLYDHCLSAKEVKEISKGLICHYKLDNNGFGNPNLITTMSPGGRTTLNGKYGLNADFSQNTDTYGYFNVSPALELDTTYTLSFDVSNFPKGGSWNFMLWNNANYEVGTITKDGHYTYTFVPSTSKLPSGYNLTKFLFDDWSRTNPSGVVHFTNFKIEKGNKATPWCPHASDSMYTSLGLDSASESDCSGYKNNGIKVGNVLSAESGGRYDTSTYCNSSNIGTSTPTGAAFIKCTLVNPIVNATALTINWWGNIEDYSYQNSGILSLSNDSSYPTDYLTSALAQYDSMFRFNLIDGNDSSIDSLALIETGNWHMYTLVFNNGIVQGYRDGMLVTSNSKSGTLAQFAYVYMGINVAGGAHRQTKSKWSDFRIYSTALSDSDIKELYNISASVDKNGNMYAYEFKEE